MPAPDAGGRFPLARGIGQRVSGAAHRSAARPGRRGQVDGMKPHGHPEQADPRHRYRPLTPPPVPWWPRPFIPLPQRGHHAGHGPFPASTAKRHPVWQRGGWLDTRTQAGTGSAPDHFDGARHRRDHAVAETRRVPTIRKLLWAVVWRSVIVAAGDIARGPEDHRQPPTTLRACVGLPRDGHQKPDRARIRGSHRGSSARRQPVPGRRIKATCQNTECTVPAGGVSIRSPPYPGSHRVPEPGCQAATTATSALPPTQPGRLQL